ncbi:MAG TPA: cytochrome c-type biogenesis protein CcmH [Solirubrobacteraceae bacterium]|jgi:cytochrome c-type biogenesis protein CcmH/NrfF
MRRLAASLLAVLALLAPAAAAAPAAKTSLTTIERQVMCVTCKIPLNVAESPQADRERAFIQRLIIEGRSESQIKSALVDQYGASVLGLPKASGFDLAVYLVPIAVVLALLVLLAVLLPRWRRRVPAHASAAAGAPAVSGGEPRPLAESDTARLESDMARYD